MKALEAQGNVPEGLRVFEQLRTLLREELGTIPSAEAIAVHETLLRPSTQSETAERDATNADLECPMTGPHTISLPVELGALSATEMIGRVSELEDLERWLADAGHEGDSDHRKERLLLLIGDPGIGMSRLLA